MKNKFKILLVLLVLLSTTGCTKILKDENKKGVVNTNTNQALVENILCKPEDPTTIDIYNKYQDNQELQR